MKVGLYTPGIDRRFIGGPTKYQINLANALVKIKNIEVYLLHHKFSFAHNFEVNHIIISDKKPLFWEIKVNKINLDIIHFNLIPISRRIFFPTLRSKKVATVHGDLHWIKASFSDYNSPKSRIRRMLEPWTCMFMDAIIMVSHNLKERLIPHLKIPDVKIKVIHEGVSPIYKPLKNASYIKKKYNISRPFIFHVSNLSLKKNPITLFKTFKNLIEKGYNLELVIAGARWKKNYIKRMIENFGIASKVKFLGYVPEKDLVALYNAAEAFFYPSLHETFGFPVLEAMACGTPVVTSRVYSLPEITGDAAILCDPHNIKCFSNAIESLLKDESLKNEMVSKGLRNVKRFSWEKCARETIKVYKKILNE